MIFFFYCPWHDKHEWLKKIKKKFYNNKIVTLKDKPKFSEIEYAIIWELPNEVYQKLNNLKLIFSMGAGVDHILNLPNYNNVPIVRLKDINMAERMSNHIISQILQYQLNLRTYMESQTKHVWKDFKIPSLNADLTIGILGVGFLAVLTIAIDHSLPNKRISTISAIFFGLIVGLILTYLFQITGTAVFTEIGIHPSMQRWIYVIASVLLSYICITVLLQTQGQFRFVIPYVEFSKEIKGKSRKYKKVS